MSIVFSARLTSVSNTFVQFITYLITSIVWLVLALHLILSFGVYGATYYILMVSQFTLHVFLSWIT